MSGMSSSGKSSSTGASIPFQERCTAVVTRLHSASAVPCKRWIGLHEPIKRVHQGAVWLQGSRHADVAHVVQGGNAALNYQVLKGR